VGQCDPRPAIENVVEISVALEPGSLVVRRASDEIRERTPVSAKR
jgi:hypothetical protein